MHTSGSSIKELSNKSIELINLCTRKFVFGFHISYLISSQAAITCSTLTTETLEQGVKYVQS